MDSDSEYVDSLRERIEELEAEVETRGKAVSTLDEYNRRIVEASRETLHQKVTLEQASTEAHLQAQRRIEALEAEVARLGVCARCQGINEGLVKAKHATEMDADSREQALLKQIEVFRETNQHLEQQLAALEAEVARLQQQVENWEVVVPGLQSHIAKLRQPCAHTPPGSDPACVWCLVRMALERRLTWEARHDVLQAFDAAVQAVREETHARDRD